MAAAAYRRSRWPDTAAIRDDRSGFDEARSDEANRNTRASGTGAKRAGARRDQAYRRSSGKVRGVVLRERGVGETNLAAIEVALQRNGFHLGMVEVRLCREPQRTSARRRKAPSPHDEQEQFGPRAYANAGARKLTTVSVLIVKSIIVAW